MLRSFLQRVFEARPGVESRYVRDEGRPRVVVFVHGLRGDPRETWRNQENGATWSDLLARDPNFTRFDVYLVGCHSAVRRRASTIEEVAQRVLQQLRDHHVFDRDEVYFIAHSMGGVVTKRMLTSLRGPVDAATLSRVRGVLYLATPAQGAPLAAISLWLKMSPQVGDLAPNVGSFLQALENDWEDLLRDRDTQRIQFPRVFSAYETRPFRQVMIVEREWARTRCDANAYPVDLDHRDIVKPADVRREPYPWAKARILEATGLRSDQLSLPAADPRHFAARFHRARL